MSSADKIIFGLYVFLCFLLLLAFVYTVAVSATVSSIALGALLVYLLTSLL